MEQPVIKPALIWDAGIAGGSFTCQATNTEYTVKKEVLGICFACNPASKEGNFLNGFIVVLTQKEQNHLTVTDGTP